MTRAEAWHTRLLASAEKYKDQFTFTKVTWNTNTLGGGYALSFYDKTYHDGPADRRKRTRSSPTRRPLFQIPGRIRTARRAAGLRESV